ncbi:HU family DNA-binding protein [Fusobacterium sp.]|uniref:HU family DNA-binding protein n=1 Tax=Fusobacterium sp. TaxID=68766 RepID=UPI00261D5DCA|nr:HU family DNA-binding protein [Fusobacterium sp.]
MRKKEFKKFYAEFNKLENEKASEEVEIFLETMKKAFSLYPKIVFRNFGTFEIKETKERKVLDPRGSGDIIHTKPRKYVKFKISKNVEDEL